MKGKPCLVEKKPFSSVKKANKQTTCPFLMQLVFSRPSCALPCKMFLSWRNAARLLDAWGHGVLFAVAESTICLHLYVPKSSLTGSLRDKYIHKNKVSAKNCKPFVCYTDIGVLAQSYM